MKRILKKGMLLSIFVALSILGAACSGGGNKVTSTNSPTETEKPAERTSPGSSEAISIVTGATSGTYYPLGGGIGKALNGAGIGVNATVESTGGSNENVRLLGQGEAEIGFTETGIAYYGYEGIEMFKDNKFDNLRGIMSLYANLMQTVVMKDSGIQSYADLKGKTVAIGIQGSSSALNMQLVLKEYGLSLGDIKPQFVSYSEGVTMLKDGQIDAVMIDSGIPNSAVTDITTQHDVNILPIEEEKIKSLVSKYPYFSNMVIIPKGTYEGIDVDVPTAGAKVMLVTHAGVSEEMVYKLTKTIFEKKEEIIKIHPRGDSIDLKTATDGMSIPLHPGAEKYLREQGAIK
ncbi:TAXI family TRAP transporter solute-binding subunit [Peribacillus saganii]|uniref:TAXI family TRAP transporter solute-binding subunit n=1 Tax=Peribacillus saganii TaxID=2303992 RepID=A0A372LQB0_9BACI|nr:TAXI family TRAP transporter solute-binding subunit [Peribacillus saganii]RFU70391.1 TAXI family TRAP transporter solute-binding subunit [Peribacillus saganii]